MQGSKLYVGNLKYSVIDEDLRELFSAYGEIVDIKVIEGKGFAFVEMSSQTEADEAKEALNETDFKGRNMFIDEAKPPRKRENRSYSAGRSY